MIPDRAVEMAARAHFELGGGDWEDTILEYQNEAIDNMRAALEAAAPSIAAEAWDEGFDRGFYDPLAGSHRDASESLATNPYQRLR